MPDSPRLPLWAGRTAALLGIVLVAFTLRQAVAAISPILGDIRVDIPISNIDVGLLGTLPPLLFAASGFIAPRVARRLGLDGGIVLALVLMTAGHLVRAFAPGSRCCSSAASSRSPARASATCCCRPSSGGTSPTGSPC